MVSLKIHIHVTTEEEITFTTIIATVRKPGIHQCIDIIKRSTLTKLQNHSICETFY